jgi:predicted ATPase
MRLHITEDAFVGREAEQATLASLVAHHRFLQKRAALQVCLVHGAAGSGKTSLIHHSLSSSLRGSSSNKAKKQNQQQPQHQQQQQNGGSSSCCSGSYYFISGKCDQNQVFSSPYGEIVTAFDQLVTLAAPPERIQQCITTEARILTRLIPSFRRDLQLDTTTAVEKENVDSNPNDAGGVSKMSHDENPQGDYNADHDDSVSGRSADGDNSLTLASERLIVAFRVFLREFCSPDHPIVLFIDDLQVRT